VTEERPARVAGLETHEVDDGLVVYQAATDRVHYLNATASVIFELCTGERTAEEIAALVADAWQTGRSEDAATRDCLAQLRSEGIVD
jgi:hypothetical protein